jgi:hypothetical protein
MAERTPDDDLIFNIGYGLKRAGLKLPIEACRQLGARVLAHLKLAGFEFTRRAPKEAHGSALSNDIAAREHPPKSPG